MNILNRQSVKVDYFFIKIMDNILGNSIKTMRFGIYWKEI